METQELHRGRLIDHLQLVVKDLAATKRFYSAVFSVLNIPMGGEGEDYFWADELFISSKDSAAAQIPMQRLGTAEDCVGAYVFLASDSMSGYITGQIIDVNGGQLMP